MGSEELNQSVSSSFLPLFHLGPQQGLAGQGCRPSASQNKHVDFLPVTAPAGEACPGSVSENTEAQGMADGGAELTGALALNQQRAAGIQIGLGGLGFCTVGC